MKKSIIFISVAGMLVSSSVCAFDGKRKGFVLGGGLGIAPVAKWDAGIVDENKAGAAANLYLGYAWDEFNMIVAEVNSVGYDSDIGASITQGFGGAVWYHYFGPIAKSFYTATGIGFYSFDYDFDTGGSGSTDPGFAVLLGGGYEFARHFQVGSYLSLGKTTEPGINYNHTHFSIIVNAVAF